MIEEKEIRKELYFKRSILKLLEECQENEQFNEIGSKKKAQEIIQEITKEMYL